MPTRRCCGAWPKVPSAACGCGRSSWRAADALAVARVLAAVVERESPDLVLCGVQSSDAVNGATGVALAGLLGAPARGGGAARSRSIRVVATYRSSASSRAGWWSVLRVPLPALLTIQTGINEPRYANLRAIKQADKEEALRARSR